MTEVSAGVIYAEDGRILICRRGEGRRNAHLWEFPGGKREAGETGADCLRRELREELSLEIDMQDEWAQLAVTEADGIRFTFLAGRALNTPVPTEHEAIRFVEPRELMHYTFCPADVPIAKRLTLAGVSAFFWDFDGTLMDTYPAMVRAFIAGAADHGITLSPRRTLDLMKNCLQHCCEVVSAESGVAADTLRRAFRAHEAEEIRRGIRLTPGMLKTLRGIRPYAAHYVATHRSLVCRDMLCRSHAGYLFTDYVTEEDGLPRKPAPDMLNHLMEKHHLQPGCCAMVGDRPLDIEAGRAAGMLTILLDPEGRFADTPCHVRIRRPEELLLFYP